MTMATAKHHDALRHTALAQDEGVWLAPFSLVNLARPGFVKLGLIGGKSCEFSNGYILTYIVAWELGLDDLTVLRMPLCVSFLLDRSGTLHCGGRSGLLGSSLLLGGDFLGDRGYFAGDLEQILQ